MKKFSTLFCLSFILLLTGNIILFVSSMNLSSQMNEFDITTKQLAKENISLERDVLSLQSLQYAASLSASLNFDKTSQPVFFDELPVALK